MPDNISLRDYATIEFTKAWIQVLGASYRNEHDILDITNVVSDARVFGEDQADAMLAARSKEGGAG